MSQFNRQIELIIKDLEKGTITTITDLAMSFKISKSLTKDGNRAYVEVKNLSPETRNRLDNTEKILTLRVGYVGSPLEIIFHGNITTFFDSYETPEIVTKIECLDGLRSMNNAIVSVNYKSGTTIKRIISDIVNKAGWDKKNDINDLNFENAEFVGGYNHIGLARTAIDDLTKVVDLEWSFQDNAVQFTTRDSLATKDIIVVSEETGLIGVPERTDKRGVRARSRRRKKTNDRIRSEPGYIVRSLIKPKATPGSSIRLISNKLNIDNTYKIGDVEHSGNNYSNLWETKTKALLKQEFAPIQGAPVTLEAVETLA